MTKRFTIHPILFAIYPVLFLFSRNVWQTKADVIWVPLVMVVSTVLLLWWSIAFIMKDTAKAALITSIIIIPFFIYSNLHEFLYVQQGLVIGRHRYLLLLIGTMCCLSTYFIVFKLVNATLLNFFLNIVGATLILGTIPNLGNWIVNKTALS